MVSPYQLVGVKMHESLFSFQWKKIILLMFISCCILLTISYYDYNKVLSYQFLISEPATVKNVSIVDSTHTSTVAVETTTMSFSTSSIKVPVANSRYLVSSAKCKIRNLDPFNKDAKKHFKSQAYKSCTSKDLLTYVTKEDNIATVHINFTAIPQYTKNNVSCCYSVVERGKSAKKPDDALDISKCKDFTRSANITEEAVMIKCIDIESEKQVYENVHHHIKITENVRKKMHLFDNSTTKPLSILFIGIDSISRLNFIRALPKTYKFVEDHNWIPLKGYNKMDDNTFPNLMAILTGHNQERAYEICRPKTIGQMDKCPMLWYDYRNLGYVTGYAEDEASISTWNYNKIGFEKPPTDYYARPYMMAAEKLKQVIVSSMAYCTGPETTAERMFNLIKDFGTTFLNNPHFGFFWMNTYSHNDINTPSMMDDKIHLFMQSLETSNIFNNTLIIFLSDHGMRFGDIRITETGWLEERLPFIYFSFPPWFKEKFPKEIDNLKSNENRFTTPYDLYITLQHILVLSGFNYTIKPSEGSPNSVSLFEKVPMNRSCADVNITNHWCTCQGYSEVKLPKAELTKIGDEVVNRVNQIVKDNGGSDKCAKYKIDEISTRISEHTSYDNRTRILVVIKANPRALFETTVTFNGDLLSADLDIGYVSRMDYYNPHSGCATESKLRVYCYCR